MNPVSRLIHKTRLFLGMGVEKQIWVVLFTSGSLLALLAIRTFKMKHFCIFFGEHQENRTVSVLATAQQRDKAWAIGRTMDVVEKNVPWECKCLAQALCVKWLLDRYRIPSATFLGAYLDEKETKGMKAHSWLTVSDYVVIGGPGHLNYKVTSVFTQTYAVSSIGLSKHRMAEIGV